jgi:hypothetical protein
VIEPQEASGERLEGYRCACWRLAQPGHDRTQQPA